MKLCTRFLQLIAFLFALYSLYAIFISSSDTYLRALDGYNVILYKQRNESVVETSIYPHVEKTLQKHVQVLLQYAKEKIKEYKDDAPPSTIQNQTIAETGNNGNLFSMSNADHASTSPPYVPKNYPVPELFKSVIDEANRAKTSPDMAFYPYYAVEKKENASFPFVYPFQQRSDAALNEIHLAIDPVFARGVVYYVYSNTLCQQGSKYLREALLYSRRLKEMSPHSRIALVTNCDLTMELFLLIDVVVPIHPADLIQTTASQFYTRVLYNANPPFSVALVMDAHVQFCQNDDLEEALRLFTESKVDLAYSTRLLNAWVTSGFAVLYRGNPVTELYWQKVARLMHSPATAGDDQYMMNTVTESMRRTTLRFRWLSNNWFYATHGVDEKGAFFGKSNCYRSSVLVNGRVRFIHASIGYCGLVNGLHNQYTKQLRTIYIPGKCSGIYSHSKLVQTQAEFASLTGNYTPPAFNWNLLIKESPDALFWFSEK